MLLTEKKESAKNVGITNDYTFLQHQSLPCVHTFANMHRCRGRKMLIGLIFVCTSLCKKCFISIMRLLHYTVRICGGLRFNMKSQNLARSYICHFMTVPLQTYRSKTIQKRSAFCHASLLVGDKCHTIM